MTDMPATEPLEAAPLTPPPSRERAFRDVLVQVLTRVMNLALGIVVTALVVRTLGDTGYGQWMTILTTFQLIGFFTSWGWSRSRSARRRLTRPTPRIGSARWS